MASNSWHEVESAEQGVADEGLSIADAERRHGLRTKAGAAILIPWLNPRQDLLEGILGLGVLLSIVNLVHLRHARARHDGPS